MFMVVKDRWCRPVAKENMAGEQNSYIQARKNFYESQGYTVYFQPV